MDANAAAHSEAHHAASGNGQSLDDLRGKPVCDQSFNEPADFREISFDGGKTDADKQFIFVHSNCLAKFCGAVSARTVVRREAAGEIRSWLAEVWAAGSRRPAGQGKGLAPGPEAWTTSSV